jgi:hypothetical protein
VVSVRDDVRAGVAQLARDFAGEPGATRGVLAVENAEVDLSLPLDGREQRRDRLTSGLTDDVADKEDPQAGSALTSRTRRRASPG